MDTKTLDRRGFIGAAAGAAAAGAALTGPLAGQRKAEAATQCLEQDIRGVPPWRRGWIGATPAAVWNTSAAMTSYLQYLKDVGTRNLEGVGNNYGYFVAANFPAAPGKTNAAYNAWVAGGSAFRAAGVAIVGDHAGPDGSSANNVGSAIAKANALNCNAWGSGGGNPGVPGAGTALTALTGTNSITSWQQTAATMNMFGWRFQNAKGPAPAAGGAAVPAMFDYGDGAGPVALTQGRKCARYYRHYHSESAKWIDNPASIYHHHYTGEVAVNEADIHYAYGQPDMGWMLDGLWMAGGGPSVGVSTIPIVTDPSQPGFNRQYGGNSGTLGAFIGNNVLVMPDIYERSQDFWPSWHVKDLGGGTAPNNMNDQGTSVLLPGDNNNESPVELNDPVMLAANPNWKWGRSFHSWAESVAPGTGGNRTWDQSQDTTPFQESFSRLRDPGCHIYLLECDGTSFTMSSRTYYKKVFEQGNAMLSSIRFERDTQARAPLTGSTLSSSYDGSAPLAGTPLPHSYPNYPWPPSVGGADTTPTESVPKGVQGMDYSSNDWPATISDWANSTGPAPGGGNDGPYSPPSLDTGLHSYPSDTKWRPADSLGVPIPRCEVELNGEHKVGSRLRVDFLGTWTNHEGEFEMDYCFNWLRDGTPIHPPNPGFLVRGVLTGGRGANAQAPECTCCGDNPRYYVLQPEDAGRRVSCAVTARNADSSTMVISESVLVEGCAPVATRLPHLTLISVNPTTPKRIKSSKGVWTPSGSNATFAFERSTDNGATWSPVNPAYVSKARYDIPASDINQTPPVQIRAKVTVTNRKCGPSAPTLTDNVITLS